MTKQNKQQYHFKTGGTKWAIDVITAGVNPDLAFKLHTSASTQATPVAYSPKKVIVFRATSTRMEEDYIIVDSPDYWIELKLANIVSIDGSPVLTLDAAFASLSSFIP